MNDDRSRIRRTLPIWLANSGRSLNRHMYGEQRSGTDSLQGVAQQLRKMPAPMRDLQAGKKNRSGCTGPVSPGTEIESVVRLRLSPQVTRCGAIAPISRFTAPVRAPPAIPRQGGAPNRRIHYRIPILCRKIRRCAQCPGRRTRQRRCCPATRCAGPAPPCSTGERRRRNEKGRLPGPTLIQS